MTLLPVAATAVKFIGPKMGLRLLLLLVAGLGALYTMHLLAQDFMKIGSAVGSTVSGLFGKRDVGDANLQQNITQMEIEFEQKIDWNKILRRDPFNCALSLVCQLSAGAEKKNDDANRIYEFITHTINHSKVPNKLRKAYELGMGFNINEKEDFKKCYKSFPICPYSAETMLKLITFNKFIFG